MLSTNDFLRELRHRGALRLRCVRFRTNRSTVWSLTQHGTVLNVHSAFRAATPSLLDSFALLAMEGGIGSTASRRAASDINEWPELAEAMRAAREQHEAHNGGKARDPAHCCASAAQRSYLYALYRYFNCTRFESALPDDIPVRLSSRMRSALGHMLPGHWGDGTRRVLEIALNVDLMLRGNGAERVDTLLHEMAHAADYLESGERGHGASWRRWAARAGCQPTTLYDRPVRLRVNRSADVTRVPPLPEALRLLGPAENFSGPARIPLGVGY